MLENHTIYSTASNKIYSQCRHYVKKKAEI